MSFEDIELELQHWEEDALELQGLGFCCFENVNFGFELTLVVFEHVFEIEIESKVALRLLNLSFRAWTMTLSLMDLVLCI